MSNALKSTKVLRAAKRMLLFSGGVGLMLFFLTGCAAMDHQPPPAAAETSQDAGMSGAPAEAMVQPPAVLDREEERALPVRFRQPSYLVSEAGYQAMAEEDEGLAIQVGADISSRQGPVPLRDILKRLAGLKKMNVSWASDVDQLALVDVDISASDDFFQAIDNLLRQIDYYHEVEGNTIVVKYKETRKFHLALPPRLAGSNTSNAVSGSATNVDSESSRWEGVRANLDQVLKVWAGASTIKVAVEAEEGEQQQQQQSGGQQEGQLTQTVEKTRDSSGFYNIDEDLGLIIVTAPRTALDKVETYIENLKSELYRQISLEAKIIEVTLDQSSKSGIDWSNLFQDSTFNLNMEFGDSGEIYPNGAFINRLTMDAKGFNLVLDAIRNYGETKVLSNPRISVMNGQPAVIYVGDNVTYIDTVTTTVGDSGAVSTSVSTAQASSGLRLEIFPTIVNEDEIVLSLIPTVSGLTQPIEYRVFGTSQVGLPEIKERTMNSIVRVKNGQMLVVGGLIDTTDDDTSSKVKLLGEMPLVNKLFSHEAQQNERTELIILLKPRII